MTDRTGKNVTRKVKKNNLFDPVRVLIVMLLFALVLTGVIFQLVNIQIIQGAELKSQAIEQRTKDTMIAPKRGTIYDRNMKALAVSASVERVCANPEEIQKAGMENQVAIHLSRILDLNYQDVRDMLSKNTKYVQIKSKVETAVTQEIKNLIADNRIIGVDFEEDAKRYYPYNNFASHIIGTVGKDNQGLSGIEIEYDSYLKGTSGRVVSTKNPNGGDIPYDSEKYYHSEDGYNVVLTIDEVIQHYVENHLSTAVIENKLAMGAAAIVMDVKTGEILAMTTKPDYNLNQPFTLTDTVLAAEIEAMPEGEAKDLRYSEAVQQMWRNKAVSDMYEPGSVFKVFTAAAAMEENLVNENDSFVCTGVKKVAVHDIHCWKREGHGVQSFPDAIKNSCNPAFMTIGDRIGAENFIKYVNGFNLIAPTGIDLPGEANGLFFKKEQMGVAEIATTSFGQGFEVTPIQMVSALAAVANGGKYMKPHVVKELTDSEGKVVKQFSSEFSRQIISEETAKKLCGYLERVVSEGSGKNAYVQGFRVAGKTGTSEKRPRNNGKYIASFGGFAPADDPEIAVLIILDEPTGGAYYGGTIAAPVVGKIMNDVLRYLNVEPRLTAEEQAEKEINIPEVVGMSVEKAKEKIVSAGFTYTVKGSGDTVIDQIPKSSVHLKKGATVALYTEENPAADKIVPAVIGMTPSQANYAIVNAGLNMKLTGNITGEGDSVVVSQDPLGGTIVNDGSVVYVEIRHLDVE